LPKNRVISCKFLMAFCVSPASKLAEARSTQACRERSAWGKDRRSKKGMASTSVSVRIATREDSRSASCPEMLLARLPLSLLASSQQLKRRTRSTLGSLDSLPARAHTRAARAERMNTCVGLDASSSETSGSVASCPARKDMSRTTDAVPTTSIQKRTLGK